LKEQHGQDIVITGSIRLCHTVIEAGLVDEYRLFVHPVVQGRGRRLFPDGFELPRLELLESRGFSGGIVYSRYSPVDSGRVSTSTPADADRQVD
jgi:dihydrofolate reductase